MIEKNTAVCSFQRNAIISRSFKSRLLVRISIFTMLYDSRERLSFINMVPYVLFGRPVYNSVCNDVTLNGGGGLIIYKRLEKNTSNNGKKLEIDLVNA